MNSNKSCFIRFKKEISRTSIPDNFNFIEKNTPHPLCIDASIQLQDYLINQQNWEHNFGLKANDNELPIGKMFGVLVVENAEKEVGFLVAFSGKLAGTNTHDFFVPAIFDSLTENSFFNQGMEYLSILTSKINLLKTTENNDNTKEINLLVVKRKAFSKNLQKLLFDNYFFTNQYHELKSVYDIFPKTIYKNPPSGAGECAGPKLLQYAFQNNMKPIAIAEFWWGLSPKSTKWKHKQFYECCEEKCAPILNHMMSGIDTNLNN